MKLKHPHKEIKLKLPEKVLRYFGDNPRNIESYLIREYVTTMSAKLTESHFGHSGKGDYPQYYRKLQELRQLNGELKKDAETIRLEKLWDMKKKREELEDWENGPEDPRLNS